ncbi:MAG: TetR/AcrR family transcriptional regulator [Xanthobacteraceae bacterium]|nr:TetR/AcrR family transcriptional regulator [Xanthobacteraceae bacterium]
MKAKKKKPARRPAPQRGKAYHHGDLAAALIEAAEAVLTERGLEGFTLRECARRAGVSHAAPAHHFGDARGLLTEVAAVGFERLTEAQIRAREAEPKLQNLLLATGVAYVGFALTHPAQFQVMFQSGLLDHSNQRFVAAGRRAFGVYLETYSAVHGIRIDPDAEKVSDPSVLRQWALVHGFATLAVQGQLGPNHSAAEIAGLRGFAWIVLENAQKHSLPRGSASKL